MLTLDKILELDKNRTQGDWLTEIDACHFSTLGLEMACGSYYVGSDANAKFIAAAPDMVKLLKERQKEIKKLKKELKKYKEDEQFRLRVENNFAMTNDIEW